MYIYYLFAAITYNLQRIIKCTRESSEATSCRRLKVNTNMTLQKAKQLKTSLFEIKEERT